MTAVGRVVLISVKSLKDQVEALGRGGDIFFWNNNQEITKHINSFISAKEKNRNNLTLTSKENEIAKITVIVLEFHQPQQPGYKSVIL